jgi:SAM-dependent methyltransferase
MIVRSMKRLLYGLGVQRYLSRRRLSLIDRLLMGHLLDPAPRGKKILDVGCATGKDFVTFFGGRKDVEIVGLDLKDYGLRQHNFRMIVGDAADIPFPDRYFDITVSIGVLEHIHPMEKLARVNQEIDRVSKSYVVIVPSVSTIIEPHIGRFFWHLQDRNTKPTYPGTLVYMSDDAWLAFAGFEGSKSCRYWHIPPVVANLFIYKDTNRA